MTLTTTLTPLPTGSINYKHEQNVTTWFFKTKCTYNVSAANLGPGSHTFHVVMYPNITSTITEEIKKRSYPSISVDIYYPKALLRDECSINGFIKENETRICTCYNNNTSILRTNVIWRQNDKLFNTSDTIKFQAKRNSSFQCTISNDLNWKDTVEFQPNVSYPPEFVSVNINNQELDICSNTTIDISGTCFVTGSNPEPSVYININDSLTEITWFKSLRGYIFNEIMKTAGFYSIFCLANSTEYSNHVSSIQSHVVIYGPPENPIIFKSRNTANSVQCHKALEVLKGDTMTCESKGGFPSSKNITLTCGDGITSAINQDQVSLTLKSSSTTNGTCECNVWHESKCLQNRTTTKYKFVVAEKSQVPTQDFEKIYTGAGAAAGCVVVITALICMGSRLRQGRLKKSLSGLTEKSENNEDLYFSKLEITRKEISIYPEYTNVVTSMASAMETPKNFSKNNKDFYKD